VEFVRSDYYKDKPEEKIPTLEEPKMVIVIEKLPIFDAPSYDQEVLEDVIALVLTALNLEGEIESNTTGNSTRFPMNPKKTTVNNIWHWLDKDKLDKV
jgi:hypothetical protein